MGPRCGGRDCGSQKKKDEDEPTWIEIPEDFIINAAESPIEQIVNEMISQPGKLPGPTITYNNADEVCKASTDVLEQQHLYPAEFLNTLNFLGMPPYALNIKKEHPIMLLRNVNL
ncbi:ATP-dependent DNA helicase PIF1-like protein, partial [Tanacetum coccineum]